jgi:hypothetical protein
MVIDGGVFSWLVTEQTATGGNPRFITTRTQQIKKKNVGATLKFCSLGGQTEASSIRKIHSCGVACDPHCYLARSARYI